MASKPGQQTSTIHILSNISQSKGNQNMKFGQLIEPRETFFFKDYTENAKERLAPGLFLLF